MKTGLLISSQVIPERGGRVYFDLKIPQDCTQLLGLHTSVQGWGNPWDYGGNAKPFYAGQLLLAAQGTVVYAGEVELGRDSEPWSFQPQRKAFPLETQMRVRKGFAPLNLSPPGTLRGQYQDELLNRVQNPQAYVLKLTLHYQKGGSDD